MLPCTSAPAATSHQAHADLFSPAELGYCPVSSVQCTVALFVKRQINIYHHNYIIHLFIFYLHKHPDTENVRCRYISMYIMLDTDERTWILYLATTFDMFM